MIIRGDESMAETTISGQELSCIVITGLSGAGKSEAARAFEDLGYFCIDNLPVMLIPKLAELLSETSGRIDKWRLL